MLISSAAVGCSGPSEHAARIMGGATARSPAYAKPHPATVRNGCMSIQTYPYIMISNGFAPLKYLFCTNNDIPDTDYIL